MRRFNDLADFSREEIKDLIALAARLDAGLNWDLVELVQQDGQLVGKRPALGDSVLVDVGWTSTPRLTASSW